MARTIETTVYQYDELSEAAQEKAREWYRTAASIGDDFFSECVIEDAACVAEILGIDIRQTRKTLLGGGHRYEPTVYFSGFWSQGDGACFDGRYSYKKGASKAIREYCPDKELHRIADALQAAQKKNFYKLWATCKHSGHYYHSGCMAVDVGHDDDSPCYRSREIGISEDDIRQLMRDFADWIYKQLENEWEYQNSDEQVTESIRANEYEFTENGERA